MSKLRAYSLSKQFKSRTVVDEASLSVSEAEVVGLLGPNGAGKTTTFYMMIGLIKPDTGRIELDNQDITKLPIHQRARLGLSYLPQEASVFRKLSVRDNVLAILELSGNYSRTQRHQRANQLLEELGIAHLADTLGISLSGGERRRTEIARALACDPRFILLDEPFAGVDPIAVADIRNIITHLTDRNIGVLITDHNVRETLKSCDKAYILSEGSVIASGSAQDIVNHEEARRVYLGEDFTMN
ncbi:LPS export ABC transporter ATP-binding protein [Suttonella sp. R2A3]|uniref:LPS export ABC transporter ATP-binding protein n=1 Tax=Suttonella sp. R2A3 TaxID=2908648 RepID=UPI001F35DF35|nr:LPS export ABC transporter ATP-binding protein [Suttonella sp. R2A3]UJF24598.1 LPS export ABC transporter ATP-binding protein [Suttonella sp. R2A3]